MRAPSKATDRTATLYYLTASMRARIPALMTTELSETFVYRSIGFPDVDNGFVRKPSPSFVFEIKVDVGKEWVDERQDALQSTLGSSTRETT
jgi:hypothetical protein